MGFVQDLAVFIQHSPLRISTYAIIVKDFEPDKPVESLHLLCPTRWTARTKSISAVLNDYEAIYDMLLSITEESSNRENRDKSCREYDQV